MRSIKLVSIAILASLLFSGCATTLLEGPKFVQANPPSAGESLVYFYRPNSTPFWLSPELLLNGKSVLELENQGYSYLYLKPGEYDINIAWSGLSGRSDMKGKIKTEAGKTYYIRSHGHVAYSGNSYSSSGYLTTVPANKALNEITHCMFIKPAFSKL